MSNFIRYLVVDKFFIDDSYDNNYTYYDKLKHCSYFISMSVYSVTK